MHKRFTDVDMWVDSVWFRKLKPELKIFWLYICARCDAVGVWEIDIDLASYLIGYQYSMDSLLTAFKGKIKTIKDGRKWWIKDFCVFQYGKLKDDPKNKPHQSYIRLLKHHSLWKDYRKGIHTPKETEKDKEGDNEREKEADQIIDYLNLKAEKKFKHSESSRKPILARLNEGFSLADCKKVIDNKIEDTWFIDNPKWLQPSTLFCKSKFEGYLNESPEQAKKKGVHFSMVGELVDKKTKLKDWINQNKGRDKPINPLSAIEKLKKEIQDIENGAIT